MAPHGVSFRSSGTTLAWPPGQASAPPSFTKGEVNRAGELMLDLRDRTRRDGWPRAVGESGADALDRAWAALTWWRGLHARPLSSVAANLRYHVDQADGRVLGRIEVTQRLKRLSTLIGKLEREKGRVTQMHDIGGVRALLPAEARLHEQDERFTTAEAERALIAADVPRARRRSVIDGHAAALILRAWLDAPGPRG